MTRKLLTAETQRAQRRNTEEYISSFVKTCFALKAQKILFLCVLCALCGSVFSLEARNALKSLGVEVGSLAPEFTFQNEAGKWVSLSDFRGKKVFLFSWATWCRCREQLPDLEAFYRKHKSPAFEVIAVASDSQGFKWVKPYLDKAEADFIAMVDPNNELAVKYNFLATENGFFIDEAGVIRMSVIGFDIRKKEHMDELVKMLKTDFKVKDSPGGKKSVEGKIAEVENSLKAQPNSLSNMLELSELYRMRGDFDKAESILRQAITRKKNAAEAHYRLGVILYHKGLIPEAVKEWEKAFKYEPTNYLYMRNIEAYKNPEKFYSEIMNQ
ncbi:MAG: redoxin domain-containing protein [bacterium]